MQNIEVEIRVQISHSDKFTKWLNKNAEQNLMEFQEDTYYYPKHDTFIYTDNHGKKQADKWLRVRKSDNESSICYKLVHRDKKGNFIYADEYETEISDSNILKGILNCLDYQILCTVSKNRKSWKYNNYLIFIDNVKSLGDFVEVELAEITNINNIEQEKLNMMNFIKKISNSDIIKIEGGYPWLLMEKELLITENIFTKNKDCILDESY